MKTWAFFLVVATTALVMTVVAMEEEDSDNWFENMIQEYKRRPRPPPRYLSSKTPIRRSDLETIKRTCETPSPRGISQANCVRSMMKQFIKPYVCNGYGKTCTIKNRKHNCCQGLGCYSRSDKDCYGTSRCICRKTPELKYVYYMV